jgi:hypothetical protein
MSSASVLSMLVTPLSFSRLILCLFLSGVSPRVPHSPLRLSMGSLKETGETLNFLAIRELSDAALDRILGGVDLLFSNYYFV